jgi:hypothetical protein
MRVILALVLTGCAAIWWWQSPGVASSAQASASVRALPPGGRVQGVVSIEDGAVPPKAIPAPAAPHALPKVAAAGGKPPRAWSVAGGQLVPGRALRDRFDSYLPLGRGVSMVDVRAALAQDAQADLGPRTGDQVLAMWDRYARLLVYDWQIPFNGSDPQSWRATLGEQRKVRRQLLGEDWAEAFFAEDEALLQRRWARWAEGRKTTAVARSALDELLAKAPPAAASAGPAKSASSAAEAARHEWARLSQDTALDEGQRLLRIRQYLQQNFSDQDVARVEADLHLP